MSKIAAPLDAANLLVALQSGLKQGFFALGADGVCSSYFSQACLPFLAASPEGKPFAEVIRADESTAANITALLDLLFAENSQIICMDDLLGFMPAEFLNAQGAKIELSYSPIKNKAGVLQALLVLVGQGMNRAANPQQAGDEEQHQKMMMILRIASNRNVFTQFYINAYTYFSALTENLQNASLVQVQRDLHTLKGNAAIFHLQKLVNALHDVETAISAAATVEDARAIMMPRAYDFQDILLEIKAEARNILGDAFEEQGVIRSIPLDQLKKFAYLLAQEKDPAQVRAHFISSFMGEPIQKQLAPYAIGFQELADRTGEQVKPCEFIGENFPVLSEAYQPLFDSFVHIVRNIIAHAIEDDDVRAACGKPVELTVIFDTHRFHKDGREWIRISVTDDGAGINVAVLKKKLNIGDDSGLSDRDIMQYIFGDNVSTTDQVDLLSGRGAGLDAVRDNAIRLGGTAYVESEPQIFTRIVVEVPMIWAW